MCAYEQYPNTPPTSKKYFGYRYAEIHQEFKSPVYECPRFNEWAREFHEWALQRSRTLMRASGLKISSQTMQKLSIKHILNFVGVGCFIAQDLSISKTDRTVIDSYLRETAKIRELYEKWKIADECIPARVHTKHNVTGNNAPEKSNKKVKFDLNSDKNNENI